MKITANMVTVARIVLMPVPGYLLYQNASHLFVSLAVIIVLGLTDWLDGVMARKEGPTILGGLLDPVADKIFIAVIYLPLAERFVPSWDRMVIPLWIAIIIFSRDFLVTSLRTSLLLRDAPMRTSRLAKYKTALQMVGSGYFIFFTALTIMGQPEHWITWPSMLVIPLIPTSAIIYNLFKGKKQDNSMLIMLAISLATIAVRFFSNANILLWLVLIGILLLTIATGFSYLADAWSALKGKPGGIKEVLRVLLDGVVVPVSFLILLGCYETLGMSTLIILSITVEFASGGLSNLLASQKITPRFRWLALKSTLQTALCLVAFFLAGSNIQPNLPIGEICIIAATFITLITCAISFYRHRGSYLNQF